MDVLISIVRLETMKLYAENHILVKTEKAYASLSGILYSITESKVKKLSIQPSESINILSKSRMNTNYLILDNTFSEELDASFIIYTISQPLSSNVPRIVRNCNKYRNDLA